jgi:uncharacterized protein YdcH (DUF465 family)
MARVDDSGAIAFIDVSDLNRLVVIGDPTALDEIRENQMLIASARLIRSADLLDRAVDHLERPDEGDRLRKRSPEWEREWNRLADQQEKLTRDIDRARNSPDPPARREEIRGLAERQRELKKELERLTRERPEWAPALAAARRAIDRQLAALDQGMIDEIDPDAIARALRLIDERIEEVNAVAQERERRWRDSLASLLTRQRAAMVEWQRLRENAARLKKWELAEARHALPALVDEQRALALDLRALVADRFDPEPVFASLVEMIAFAMERAGQSLDQQRSAALDQLAGISRFDPVAEERIAIEASRWQSLAADRLNLSRQAIDEQGEPLLSDARRSVSLSQLRALRMLQADIKARTEAIARDDDASYRDHLRDNQLEIVRLLREWNQLPRLESP